MKTPLVTLIGRPNTGKSTLFNRLTGKRIAITSEIAGTTRDRLFYKVETPEIDFFLVDTGGITYGKTQNSIESDMRAQAEIAIAESDVVLFLVEGLTGLTTEDLEAAKRLRRHLRGKSVILIASKCDRPLSDSEIAPLFRLGLGDPFQVSALNKRGTDDLIRAVVAMLKKRDFLTKGSAAYKAAAKEAENFLNIALVGKPNVGKSSLINALLRQEKLIVSEVAGTTRDATDSLVKHQGKTYNFIDTAGLRRRSKIEKGIESFGALRSMAAIERCDIALLVLDASEPLSQQDQQVANYILSAGKGLIILANKWDITTGEAEEKTEEKEEARRRFFIHRLQRRFAFAPWAPVIFTSAVTRKNLPHIFSQVEIVRQERARRVQTRTLNTFMQQLTAHHPPAGTRAVKPKLFYITQTAVNPPEFVLFVNKKKYFHFSYLRYVENRLREKFGFTGTPISMSFREKDKRYSADVADVAADFK